MKTKNIILNCIAFLAVITLFPNCRGEIIPTDEDLSNYGWTLYEAGEYVEAMEWFQDAINKDAGSPDGYNGMGWTMGHQRQLDASIEYFDSYLNINTDFEDLFDFYAGLAFAYSARGYSANENGNSLSDDELALTYASYLLGSIKVEIGDSYWCFCHKTQINHLDVQYVLALSEYRLGLFESCQNTINSINQVVEPSNQPINLGSELQTVHGRRILLEELESLYEPLNYGPNSINSHENGLGCTEPSNNGIGFGYCYK